MSNEIDDTRLRKLLFSYPAKAMQFLYKYHYSKLLSIAMSLTQDIKISQDIVQEAFIAVWEKHELIAQEHQKPLDHYLARIVRNKSASAYKTLVKESRNNISYKLNYQPEIEYSEEHKMIAYEQYLEVIRLISSFPRREKQCLLMSLDEEMTYKEIAEQLNVTVKAVERCITSANKRLKKYWTLK